MAEGIASGVQDSPVSHVRSAFASSRKATTVGGALFFVATVSYLIGSSLIDSFGRGPIDLANVNETKLRLGVALECINAGAVVGIGILLFARLRTYRHGMALGYAATRVIESALLLGSAVWALLLGPASRGFLQADPSQASQFLAAGNLARDGYDLSFQLAMIALGTGSLGLCYVLYESRLIPRVLAVLGFVGYLTLIASSWMGIANADGATWLYVPGAIFEIAFPVWLITKGLNETTPGEGLGGQE